MHRFHLHQLLTWCVILVRVCAKTKLAYPPYSACHRHRRDSLKHVVTGWRENVFQWCNSQETVPQRGLVFCLVFHITVTVSWKHWLGFLLNFIRSTSHHMYDTLQNTNEAELVVANWRYKNQRYPIHIVMYYKLKNVFCISTFLRFNFNFHRPHVSQWRRT